MRDLPHDLDFDSLEAEELSKPGSEFIQKPTKEQYAEAVRNGLARMNETRGEYSVPAYSDGFLKVRQAG